MSADIAHLWVFKIPLIILLKYAFHMDEYAIWWPMLISNILTDVMLLIFYISKRWEKQIKKR